MRHCAVKQHVAACACHPSSHAGGLNNCSLRILNSGNVGLENVTVPDQDTGCPMLSYLAPGADHNCTMSRAVSQQDFDDWDTNGTRLFLTASVTGWPTGVVAKAQVNNVTNSSVALVSRPSFTLVSASVAPTLVWYAGGYQITAAYTLMMSVQHAHAHTPKSWLVGY